MGEKQLGLMNIMGWDLDLWQHNGSVAVPFLVSSRGYGILWDNNSFTRFGDLRETESIPATQLFDALGNPGNFTASYYAGANFEKLAAKQSENRIEIALPDGLKEYNQKIHPLLP